MLKYKLLPAILSLLLFLLSLASCGGDNPEIPTEPISGQHSEQITETPTEPVSEQVTEKVTEKTTEDSDIDLSGFDIDYETEKSFSLDFLPLREDARATGSVYVRRVPSYDSSDTIVGTLTNGETLLRIGYTPSWSRVVYKGNVAYVSSKYLDGAIDHKVEETGIRYEGKSGSENAKYTIVIDAGHQARAMTDTEPDGPGSSVMKMKVTAGTMGVSTGKYESELNLEVALLLRDMLIERGYTVVMVRESQNVTLSNSERAAIANGASADVFIRIHANGDNDSSLRGAMTVCQTANNPYNADIYRDCRALSDAVLDSFCDSTGMKKRSVWETDTMSGTNWSSVVTTIVEMGFMSNPEEDELMATAKFKTDAAKGIADGIEKYLAEKN